ncbi:hypothetical protein L873DRAFT_1802093 [Choiromyces venosus 120613-1]|uniref:Uncharacterized protein n=1 Tax=Choiromyces venosus 120613-1 TaxID=1336337 RepID=A0A3N4JWA2_9PEZI|nr:hypothetical protein L873DRAFT_1802093 [Choiromyces venosus 120613-1]
MAIKSSANSDKERIAMLIEDDPNATIEDITQQSGFHVSERLIANEAQVVQGYCSFIAKMQEAILPSHRMTRLVWGSGSERLECKRLENMHFHQ